MIINAKTLFDVQTLKDYSIQLALYSIIINFILAWSFYDLGKNHSLSTKSSIERMIEEHGNKDILHEICYVTGCKKIADKYTQNVYQIKDGGFKNIGKMKDTFDEKYILTFKDYKISTDFTFVYDIQNIRLKTDSEVIIGDAGRNYFLINLVFLLVFSCVFFKSRYKEKKRQMLMVMGTEGSLRERNMRILTENIHHELNTPVAIIRGTLKKIELDLLKTDKECFAGKYPTIDFSQMYYALDQIDTVLQRMSNFKQIKYSNGNKTIANIVRYSANSMNIYKRSNFKIDLSDELNNYNLKGDLGNGDLMNIVSNHLRNSLEAGSDTIMIQCKFVEGKVANQGKLHIFIIDNGNGIRDRRTGLPLSEANKNQVFQPYYSTKDNEGNSKKELQDCKGIKKLFIVIKSLFDNYEENKEVRGVGLYLNKQMLIENGGNLFLRETSEDGTVFEIVVPAKETDTLISQKQLLEKVLGTSK